MLAEISVMTLVCLGVGAVCIIGIIIVKIKN